MSRAEAKPFSVDPSDYACMAHELRSREPRQRELRHSGIVDGSTVFKPTFREALAAWRQHHNLARPSDVDRQVEMRATALPHGAVGGNSSETQLGLPATTQLCCPCDAVMHQAADGAPSSSSTSSFSMTSGGVCFGCQRWFADEDSHSRHRCSAEGSQGCRPPAPSPAPSRWRRTPRRPPRPPHPPHPRRPPRPPHPPHPPPRPRSSSRPPRPPRPPQLPYPRWQHAHGAQTTDKLAGACHSLVLLNISCYSISHSHYLCLMYAPLLYACMLVCLYLVACMYALFTGKKM
jgi:hypothetical protein